MSSAHRSATVVFAVMAVLLTPRVLTGQTGAAAAPVTEQALLERIANDPGYVPHYLDAADWFFAHGRIDEARRLLEGAVGLLRRETVQGARTTMVRVFAERGPRGDVIQAAPPELLTSLDQVFASPGPGGADSGLVSVTAVVNPEGHVTEVSVLAAPSTIVADVARGAVRDARFAPTGLDELVEVELQWPAGPGGGRGPVQVIPSRRQLTGYTAAARAFHGLGWMDTAIEAVDRALIAVRREERAPGRVSLVREEGSSRFIISPDVVGRPVRHTGRLPAYPEEALTAEIEGVVIVPVLIDASGRVIRVEEGDGPAELLRAATDAVADWRFVPAHVDGVAMARLVPVYVSFTSSTGLVSDQLRVGAGGIVPPRKVVDMPPSYPASAQQAGIEGAVILDAAIGPDGRVLDAAVRRSLTPELDAAARTAVLQWQFAPTLVRGTAVEVHMTVTIRFRLLASR